MRRSRGPVVAPFMLLLTLVAPVAAGFWTIHARAVSSTSQQAPDDSQIDTGRKVYEAQKCATCHQIAKRGNSRFPLDGVGSRLTPDQLRRWITDTAQMEAALPRMPAIRMSAQKFRLNARELDALVAYLASLK